MRKKTILSWSSGKDSAWALHLLKQEKDIEIVGLVTTVNQAYNRVAMHAVHMDLLLKQAEAVDLPITIIQLPDPCSNEKYQSIMREHMLTVQKEGIKLIAFGDIFLEDIREYREKNLIGSGIEAIFPLWGKSTSKLAQQMINSGLTTYITCVDPSKLAPEFAGREFNQAFLSDLPAQVDPCGEQGEFHTFVINGPGFNKPLKIKVGELVQRRGFVFRNILPGS
jgi:uncharacterized protein (TIGR00290 family)